MDYRDNPSPLYRGVNFARLSRVNIQRRLTIVKLTTTSRHRLHTLAVTGADQTCDIGRTHPHPGLVPQCRQKSIERMFCRLKDCRRLATRYDKLAANFLANIHLAAAIMWWL